jgi:hypothetical protein
MTATTHLFSSSDTGKLAIDFCPFLQQASGKNLGQLALPDMEE